MQESNPIINLATNGFLLSLLQVYKVKHTSKLEIWESNFWAIFGNSAEELLLALQFAFARIFRGQMNSSCNAFDHHSCFP